MDGRRVKSLSGTRVLFHILTHIKLMRIRFTNRGEPNKGGIHFDRCILLRGMIRDIYWRAGLLGSQTEIKFDFKQGNSYLPSLDFLFLRLLPLKGDELLTSQM